MTVTTAIPTMTAKTAAAGLGTRLLCALYDAFLMGGLLMCVGFAHGLLTHPQPHQATQDRLTLQIVMVLAITAYFVGFWSGKHGQTLAMKTWHLRIVNADGSSLHVGKAIWRFALSWLWIAPGLVVLGLNTPTPTLSITGVVLGVSLLCYAGLTWALPERQYLHDVLCKTRFIKTAH